MKFPHSLLLLGAASLTTGVVGADPADYGIQPDVVYGHKLGMALTFDAIKPKAPANGAGVLFMVSGGWVSQWVPPQALLAGDLNASLGFTALLEKGYTIFLVRHGSSPRFKVPECLDDVRRAARYVHGHAADWGVDPARLGVYGASAGGHLSLMLGTTGDDGKPDARDPVDQASDRVAAVVAIFPPSELKSYLESESMRTQFPALQFDAADWRPVSPIEHVSADDAPTLLLHGDKDTLVPDTHSRQMHQALLDKGVASDLIIFPGAAHGFGSAERGRAIEAMVAWFDKYLSPAREAALAGVWKSRATLPDGAEFPSTMTFSRDAAGWKGDSVSERGPRRLDHIVLEGPKLKFDVGIERDGEPLLIRVQADAEGAHRFVGTWGVHRKDATEALAGGRWEATRESPVALAPVGVSPLAGEWTMSAKLGDDTRDYVLRFEAGESGVKGTLVSPRSGDHPVESAVLDDGNLTMRLKRTINGTEVTLIYSGRLDNGALAGKVVVEGHESEFSGEWTAKRK